MTPHGTAETKALAAQAYDTTIPLTFVRHLSDDDVFIRGGTGGAMFVVPGLWSTMSPTLLTVLRVRRAASSTGRCPECDACVSAAGTDEVGVKHLIFEHENDCPVSDDSLRPLLKRWLRQVGRVARGRRLQEEIEGGPRP